MTRSAQIIIGLVGAVFATAVVAQDRPQPPKSGRDFQSAETRALQDDDANNPAMLWVEQGGRVWNTPAGPTAKSCATCHALPETSMKGVAARYPTVDLTRGELLNIERRINVCRTEQQNAPTLPDESNELLALTALIGYQSRGQQRNANIAGAAKPYFETGRKLFYSRQGQLNLACSQCHEEHAGRKLRGDTISQGQTHGWPAYRLEWQSVGSLHRRLRACSLGVRAEVLPYGAPDYIALELYLAWRGEGLPIESPGVRR